MQIVGEHDTDIRMDKNGQPVSDRKGDVDIVSEDDCWLQDLKNEALTEAGELFYEDEEGNGCYGWGLLDFFQAEMDEFRQLEIQQRIHSKMAKREYIDAASIKMDIRYDGHQYQIRVSFRRNDSSKEYNIDIESDGVEVVVG